MWGWKHSISILATACLSGCDVGSREGAAISNETAGNLGSMRMAGRYRTLIVGDTRLYLPLEWLENLIATAESQRDGGSAQLESGIEPSFGRDDANDTPHRLERNFARFGRGFSVTIVRTGPSPEPAAGINDRSQVYEISFLHFRSGDRLMEDRLINGIATSSRIDGWAKVDDRYYDTRIDTASPIDAYAIPSAAGTDSAMPNTCRFRYNRDLVVSYSWHRPGTRGFDPTWVRQSRSDVIALVRWLETPPSARETVKKLIVGEKVS